MTLRIFEVSTDGVAVPVSKKGMDREIPPPPAPAPPATPPAPAGPERWAGATEWDKLRHRLKDQEPPAPPRRRR